MKILTWNLNHRAGNTKVLPEVMEKIPGALASLDADIIVLTEYVPNPKYHNQFEKDLKHRGFVDVLMSDHYGPEKDVHNRILIASRIPLKKGNIKAPTNIVNGVPNNVFHVNVPKTGLGIIGLRMPLSNEPKSVQIRKIKHPWWEWVAKTARENINHPFILIGDFNCDLARMDDEDGKRLKDLSDEGWVHAIPMNSQYRSFYKNSESTGSTIDHAFLSPDLVLKKAEYILENNSYHFAKHEKAMSDHAVLRVEFDLPDKSEDSI